MSNWHDWPIQEKPDRNHWTLWQQAIRNNFPRTSNQSLGILAIPLGPWIDGRKDEWRWFYLASNSRLYLRTYQNPSWKVYKRVTHHGVIRKGTTFKF